MYINNKSFKLRVTTKLHAIYIGLHCVILFPNRISDINDARYLIHGRDQGNWKYRLRVALDMTTG